MNEVAFIKAVWRSLLSVLLFYCNYNDRWASRASKRLWLEGDVWWCDVNTLIYTLSVKSFRSWRCVEPLKKQECVQSAVPSVVADGSCWGICGVIGRVSRMKKSQVELLAEQKSSKWFVKTISIATKEILSFAQQEGIVSSRQKGISLLFFCMLLVRLSFRHYEEAMVSLQG